VSIVTIASLALMPAWIASPAAGGALEFDVVLGGSQILLGLL